MKTQFITYLFFLIFPLISFASESMEQRTEKFLGDHTIYKNFFFKLQKFALNSE